MTEAILGYGSVFQTWDGTDWVSIAEASAMSLPPLTRDVIDAGHESAPGEWKGHVTGLKSAGEISVTLNFTASEYQLRFEDLSAATTARRILLPDDSIYPFNGDLIGLETGVAVADKISATAKFKVLGEPGPLLTGIPFADGEPPAFYADFVNQVYWHHNTYYNNLDDWLESMSGSFFNQFANTNSGLARDESGQYQLYVNQPRFDHDTSGNPLGLLMEYNRGNYLDNTMAFHGTLGFAGDNTPVISTAVVAPYAPAQVVRHTRGTIGDNNVGYMVGTSGFPNVSVYECHSAYVWIPTQAPTVSSLTFNNEQTAAPWNPAYGQINGQQPDLSKRDQWQRVWAIRPSDNTGTNFPIPIFRCSADPGFIFYSTMWQLETGMRPTTWIPTTGANNFQWSDHLRVPVNGVKGYRTNEGTLLTYNHTLYDPLVADGFFLLMGISDLAINRVNMYKMSSTDGAVHHAVVFNADTYYSTVSAGGFLLSTIPVTKQAIAWGTPNTTSYIGGILAPGAPVATSVQPQNGIFFQLGDDSGTHVREVAYWPKRVSNSELDRLTT